MRLTYVALAITVIAIIAAIIAIYMIMTSPKHATAVKGGGVGVSIRLLWTSPPIIDRDWLVKHGLYDRAWTWWTYVKGIVAVSPNGKLIAVGAQDGSIHIFNSNGVEIRVFRFGVGRVPYNVLEFSPDGNYLIIGISSREGELLIYNTKNWRLVRKLTFAKYLAGPSNATFSTITENPWYGVSPQYAVFCGNMLYVAFKENVIDPIGQRPIYVKVTYDLFKIYPELKLKYPNMTRYVVSRYTGLVFSRIFAIDVRNWSIVWMFPHDAPAKSLFSIIAVDGKCRYVATTTWWYVDPKNPYKWHSGSIFVLNASNGRLLYKIEVPPYLPYFKTSSTWNGLAFDDKGKYLVFLDSRSDRVFVFDNLASIRLKRPVVKWEAQLAIPIMSQVLLIPIKGGEAKLKSMFVYTYGGLVGISHDRVVAYTSATYSTMWTPGYTRKPIMPHPNQTKLFILDLENGSLLYIDKFYGRPKYGKVVPFSIWNCLLAASIGHDWITGDASMAGVYVWDICRLRLIGRFLTMPKYGVPLDVAIYGNRIYVLTGPINVAHSPTEPAKIVGSYRLLALELTSS